MIGLTMNTQTSNAYNAITNAVCDVRVNNDELASLITRASEVEQEKIAEFVSAYLRAYTLEYRRANFINGNMDIAFWAYSLITALDGR